MKTIFTCKRIFKDEDTGIEGAVSACFFLEDVVQFESAADNIFDKFKDPITLIDVRSGHAIYANIPFAKFNAIMINFISRQGDLIIKMKQN